jgi:hypothetical protein
LVCCWQKDVAAGKKKELTEPVRERLLQLQQKYGDLKHGKDLGGGNGLLFNPNALPPILRGFPEESQVLGWA